MDEFLAKAKVTRCGSFKDTMEVVAKQVRARGRSPLSGVPQLGSVTNPELQEPLWGAQCVRAVQRRLPDCHPLGSQRVATGAAPPPPPHAAPQAFPLFLNMPLNVANWSADGKECSLVRAVEGLGR